MKYCVQSLFLIVLLILLVWSTCCVESVGNETFFYTYYNQIDPSYTVVYPSAFIKAIMWKDNPNLVSYNLTDKESILNLLKQHANTQTLQIGFVYTAIDSSPSRQFLKDFLSFHQLERSAPFISQRYFFHGTCQTNVFDQYDLVLMSSETFPMVIRSHRSGFRKKGLYAPTDFVSVYLEPFRIYQTANVSLNLRNGSELSCANETNPGGSSQLTRYEGEIESYFKILLGENNTLFNSNDILFLNHFNVFKIPYLISQNITNQLKEKVVSFYNILPNSSYQSYLITECAICKKDFCSEIYVEDFWFVPVAVFTIFAYLVLFISGAFRTPALRIRLLIPYLFPLGTLYFETQNSAMLITNCPVVRMVITGYFITWFITTYAFTIFRFYYLRNLYHIISIKKVKSSNRRIAFQRKISGPLWGILLTCGLSLIVSLVIASPFLILLDAELSFDNYFISNILFACIVGIGCVIGGIAIIIDMIFNKKALKEKGLKYYLFFDDPFLIRLEMFILCITIIIIAIIISDNYYVYKIGLLIIYAMVILSSGLVACFKHIMTKLFNKTHKELSNLEIYFKNDSFKNLIMEYCIKEMSIENYNCFMCLEQFKTKREKVIDLEEMKEFESSYICLNSIYEVNIPSNARKSFYELLKQVENGECVSSKKDTNYQQATNIPIYSNIIELLSVHLLTNLGDTLSRLETTNEYKIWYQLYEIQTKSAVI